MTKAEEMETRNPHKMTPGELAVYVEKLEYLVHIVTARAVEMTTCKSGYEFKLMSPMSWRTLLERNGLAHLWKEAEQFRQRLRDYLAEGRRQHELARSGGKAR